MPAERRRQSERAAATRTAILEATVELLIERGYGGTSTRLAAERAGVSLGALQYYFPTKAELSVQAMRFVTARLAAEFVETAEVPACVRERFATLVDRLYAIFRGPSFAAAVEIHLASRTDDALQEPVRELNRDVDELALSTAAALLPEMAGHPGFPALLQTTVAAARGLALTALDPADDRDRQWQLIRTQLLDFASRLAPDNSG